MFVCPSWWMQILVLQCMVNKVRKTKAAVCFVYVLFAVMIWYTSLIRSVQFVGRLNNWLCLEAWSPWRGMKAKMSERSVKFQCKPQMLCKEVHLILRDPEQRLINKFSFIKAMIPMGHISTRDYDYLSKETFNWGTFHFA